MKSIENPDMNRIRKRLLGACLLLAFIFSGVISAFGQDAGTLTQTVRGTVIDADTKAPLPGATVIILGSDPFKGTTSNINGAFALNQVPVGRVSLGVSFIGFESKTVPNLVVHSGRPTILTVELTEAVLEMDEAVVLAYQSNGIPTNEMAIAGSRSVSVEEMTRMAASFNDPAVITANFAGVRNSGTGGNDIIIRGNSPKYMQWRLEGVPITNPNHFADQSGAVGSTSTLNTNLLATSDFYTGAFPAEFGNTISGVYDIKLRNGNSENLEGIFGFGLIGTDFTLEGPLKKGNGSSFLVNVRNSTSSVLTDLGLIDVEGDPTFRDAAFKLSFPTQRAGIITAFGLGGYSTFSLSDVTPADWNSPGDSGFRNDISDDFDKSSYLFNTGINHFFALSDNSYLSSSLSYSIEGITEDMFQTVDGIEGSIRSFDSNMDRSSLRFSTEYLRKISSKTTIQAGSIYTLFMEQFDQALRPQPESELDTLLDFDEQMGNLRNFISIKQRLNEDVTITAGLHNSNVFFNENHTLEPRLAFKYQMTSRSSVSLGYGLHSTMESVHHYFADVEQSDGTFSQPNRDLGLMKAHHFIAGFDHFFRPGLLGKIEVYYQDLYDVPVENDPGSHFSTLNSGSDIEYAALVNEGSAKNYGVELTLQKFFSNSTYFLLNTTLYESLYTAMDGVERNTRFNGNYTVNVLAGKEFANLGPGNNRTLGLNAKFFLGGGHKVIPLLRDGNGNVDVNPDENMYWDYANAYESSLQDLYSITLSASYKIDHARTTHELFLNLENLTNNKGKLTEYFDPSEADLTGHTTQFGLLPNLMYRIYL
jgi:hypothetical protein